MWDAEELWNGSKMGLTTLAGLKIRIADNQGWVRKVQNSGLWMLCDSIQILSRS